MKVGIAIITFGMLLCACGSLGNYDFMIQTRLSAEKSGAEASIQAKGRVTGGNDLGKASAFTKLWEREHPTDTFFIYSSRGKFDSLIYQDSVHWMDKNPVDSLFLFNLLQSFTSLPLDENEMKEMQKTIFLTEVGPKAALFPGQADFIKIIQTVSSIRYNTN